MKCTAYSRAERSSSADGVSSCKQSPRLSLSSELSRQTSRRYGVPFFVCVPHTIAKTLQAGSSAAFEASSCQQFQPLLLPSAALWFILSQEPVVCARRLRILRALIAFSWQQQLYGLFCHRRLSAAVLLVLVFQLYNIVDFPLIHCPYGFIVQFLIINTGNGGSFVQL